MTSPSTTWSEAIAVEFTQPDVDMAGAVHHEIAARANTEAAAQAGHALMLRLNGAEAYEKVLLRAAAGAGKSYALVKMVCEALTSPNCLRVAVTAFKNKQVNALARRLGKELGRDGVCLFIADKHLPNLDADLVAAVTLAHRASEIPPNAQVVLAVAAKLGVMGESRRLAEHLGAGANGERTFDVLFVDEAWEMSLYLYDKVHKLAPVSFGVGDVGSCHRLTRVLTRGAATHATTHTARGLLLSRDWRPRLPSICLQSGGPPPSSYPYGERSTRIGIVSIVSARPEIGPSTCPSWAQMPRLFGMRSQRDFRHSSRSKASRTRKPPTSISPCSRWWRNYWPSCSKAVSPAMRQPSTARAVPMAAPVSVLCMPRPTTRSLWYLRHAIRPSMMRRTWLTDLPRSSAFSQAPYKLRPFDSWQGQTNRITVAIHPLSGADRLDEFNSAFGRLAVTCTRATHGLLMVARAGLEHLLADAQPDLARRSVSLEPERCPGRPTNGYSPPSREGLWWLAEVTNPLVS